MSWIYSLILQCARACSENRNVKGTLDEIFWFWFLHVSNLNDAKTVYFKRFPNIQIRLVIRYIISIQYICIDPLFQVKDQ
jgi:hypothetical protein